MAKKVTVDDMVEAIRRADRPVTARDIASACEVTRQTISNYRDELEADNRIEHGQVGTATAYWFVGGETGGVSPGEYGTADRDSDSAGVSDGTANTTPQPDTQQFSTLLEQLASRRAWGVFVGLVALSVVLTISATLATDSLLAPVLAHLAQITGVVGLGLGILGAFAAGAVGTSEGSTQRKKAGETA